MFLYHHPVYYNPSIFGKDFIPNKSPKQPDVPSYFFQIQVTTSYPGLFMTCDPGLNPKGPLLAFNGVNGTPMVSCAKGPGRMMSYVGATFGHENRIHVHSCKLT